VAKNPFPTFVSKSSSGLSQFYVFQWSLPDPSNVIFFCCCVTGFSFFYAYENTAECVPSPHIRNSPGADFCLAILFPLVGCSRRISFFPLRLKLTTVLKSSLTAEPFQLCPFRFLYCPVFLTCSVITPRHAKHVIFPSPPFFSPFYVRYSHSIQILAPVLTPSDSSFAFFPKIGSPCLRESFLFHSTVAGAGPVVFFPIGITRARSNRGLGVLWPVYLSRQARDHSVGAHSLRGSPRCPFFGRCLSLAPRATAAFSPMLVAACLHRPRSFTVVLRVRQSRLAAGPNRAPLLSRKLSAEQLCTSAFPFAVLSPTTPFSRLLFF